MLRCSDEKECAIMEKEKFSGMALPDDLLDAISGGVTIDCEGEDELWFVIRLDPNESCVDCVYENHLNSADPYGVLQKAACELDKPDRKGTARTLKTRLGPYSFSMAIVEVQY